MTLFGGLYALIKTVGGGELGDVYLSVNVKTSKQLAVKMAEKRNMTQARRERLLMEVSILQTLDHPNIVKLHQVIDSEDSIGLVMDYCVGELLQHVISHGRLEEFHACRLFAQIITGVNYLHSMGIVHRDLKLDNILLNSFNDVVIIDFGAADEIGGNHSCYIEQSNSTLAFASPELLKDDRYSRPSADIWSCGVILYTMLYGHLPFPDDPNNPGGLDIGLLYEYVRSTAIIYPESVSDDARDLMNAMLQVRRKNRANISTIMSHSWLSPAVDIFEDELNRKMDLLNIAGDDAIFTDSRGIERISSKHDSSEPSSPTIYQPKPRRLPKRSNSPPVGDALKRVSAAEWGEFDELKPEPEQVWKLSADFQEAFSGRNGGSHHLRMSNEVYFDFREDETVEEEIMPFDLPINSRSFEVPARTRASTASDESDTIYIPDRCESLNRRSVKTYSTYMRGSTSVSLDRTLRSASQPPLSRSTSTPMRRVLEEEPPATSTSTLNVENERIESRGRSRSRKIRDNWRQTMDRTLDRMKRSFSSFGSLGRKGMTTEFVNKREFMADDAILQELHINSQTEEERFPLANVEFNKPTRKSKSAGILGGHEKREPPALHTSKSIVANLFRPKSKSRTRFMF